MVMSLKKWFGGKKDKTIRNSSFRPQLESLDEKIVPASWSWNPVGGSTDATVLANWTTTETSIPGLNTTDFVTIGAGKGTVDFSNYSSKLECEIYVASGFNNDFIVGLNGIKMMIGSDIESGNVKLKGTLEVDAAVFTIGTASTSVNLSQVPLYTTPNLEIHSTTTAIIKNLNVYDATKVKNLSGSKLEILQIEFKTGSTGRTENSGTLDINGTYTGRNTGTYYINEIANLTNGVLNFTQSTSSTVNTFILNTYGTVNFALNTTNITGWTTAPGSLFVGLDSTGGTINLTTGAKIDSAKSLLIKSGTFNIARQSGTTGNQQAYLTTPWVYLSASTFKFENGVTTPTGQCTLSAGSTNFELTSSSTIYFNYNKTNSSCDLLACDNFYAAGIPGTATNTLWIQAFGGAPYTGSYTLIDAVTKHDNFNSIFGFGFSTKGWVGNDFNFTW